MLLYNNRSFFRLVFTVQGSIFWKPSCLLLGALCAGLSLLLRFLLEQDFIVATELQQRHHYGMHALGGVVGFAVVFRTNLGWHRYWEAVSQLHFMYSKWGDAYSQCFAFASVSMDKAAKSDTPEGTAKVMRLEALLEKLTHNFVLLSAITADRLTHGDTQRMEWRAKVAPWNKQLVKREELRTEDLTGAWNLPGFEVVPDMHTAISRRSSSKRKSGISQAGLDVSAENGLDEKGALPKQANLRVSRVSDAPWQADTNEWQNVNYLVAAQPTLEEKNLLRIVTDRVSVVMNWIIHDLARISPDLDIAPPIQSRMYQELSNGMLAFNQAMKLADVPFPLPYAQILTLLLTVFIWLIPIYMNAFTDSNFMAPLLSFALCVGMWGLNDTAIELENPFGPDVNDILLVDFHLRFIDMCHECHLAHNVKMAHYTVRLGRSRSPPMRNTQASTSTAIPRVTFESPVGARASPTEMNALFSDEDRPSLCQISGVSRVLIQTPADTPCVSDEVIQPPVGSTDNCELTCL